MPSKEIPGGLTVMFDGPDDVGKTTQIQLAKNQLEQRGYAVHATRSHGGTPIGEALRSISLSKLDRPAETDLYISLAIHQALARGLTARRAQGIITLVDRSPLSIFAYQIYGDGLDKDFGAQRVREDMATFQPELLIVYHAAREVFETRKRELLTATAAKADYFESKPPEYFDNVLRGYEVGAELFDATVIDATADMQTVHVETMRHINTLIAGHIA